jgi:hypothetical protein
MYGSNYLVQLCKYCFFYENTELKDVCAAFQYTIRVRIPFQNLIAMHGSIVDKITSWGRFRNFST